MDAQLSTISVGNHPACDSCKRAKRKCNGLASCEWCTKHAVHCVYSLPKKRGPALSKHRPLMWTQVRTVDSRAGPEVPAIYGIDDLFRNSISVANRFVKIIDRDHFIGALSVGTSAHTEVDETVRSSASVRACSFLLLSFDKRLLNDDIGSAMYMKWALDCVDSSMHERPNEFLVSAFLLLALLAQSDTCLGSDARTYCSLAHGFAEALTQSALCTDIRFAAVCVRDNAFAMSRGAAVWPAIESPCGKTAVDRAIDIASFITVIFNRGFVDVLQLHVPTLFLLLDEFERLQYIHGHMALCLSSATSCPALKSLVLFRDGNLAPAIDFALRAIAAYKQHSTLRLMSKFILSKLLLTLPVMVGSCNGSPSHLGPSAHDVTALVSLALHAMTAPWSVFGSKALSQVFLSTITCLSRTQVLRGSDPASFVICETSEKAGRNEQPRKLDDIEVLAANAFGALLALEGESDVELAECSDALQPKNRDKRRVLAELSCLRYADSRPSLLDHDSETTEAEATAGCGE